MGPISVTSPPSWRHPPVEETTALASCGTPYPLGELQSASRRPAPAKLENVTDHGATADDGTAAEPNQRCSAKDCRAPAVWAVRWRNPKIHGPGRQKIWLACDDHRD